MRIKKKTEEICSNVIYTVVFNNFIFIDLLISLIFIRNLSENLLHTYLHFSKSHFYFMNITDMEFEI